MNPGCGGEIGFSFFTTWTLGELLPLKFPTHWAVWSRDFLSTMIIYEFYDLTLGGTDLDVAAEVVY